jgi:hypothetical protein
MNTVNIKDDHRYTEFNECVKRIIETLDEGEVICRDNLIYAASECFIEYDSSNGLYQVNFELVDMACDQAVDDYPEHMRKDYNYGSWG